MHARIPLLAAAVILGGCTATIELPAPAPGHPASPAAADAPMPAPPAALSGAAPPVAPVTAEPPTAGGHEHMHH